VGHIEHSGVLSRITVCINNFIVVAIALIKDSLHFLWTGAVSVLITSSYLLAAWLNALVTSSAAAPQDLESFYHRHMGLLALASLAFTAIGATVTLLVALLRKRSKSVTREDNGGLGRTVRGLLLDYVEQRATAGDGLRQAIRIDLELTHTPAAVPVELRLVEEHSLRRSERSAEDTIAQIFKQTGGRLLILGDPGTGKSNLLHELARDLVRGARDDIGHPIPIILSLARWTLGERIRTLSEWIRDDLHELYGLTICDAMTLIRTDAIIPLLDGLDEVDETRRQQCVEAMNAYQSDRSLGRFAVCCRWEEYAQLMSVGHEDAATTSKIKVRWAIRVERLSPSDVEREVSQTGLEGVREILEADPELRSFVDTPLWLHVLFLGSLASPFSLDAGNPRDRLYDNYVSHILIRRPEGVNPECTDGSKLLRSLGWLATEMRGRNQTQFVLEDLSWPWIRQRSNVSNLGTPRQRPHEQPDPTRKGRIRAWQRLMFGSGVGALGGLAGGWIFGALVAALAAIRIEGRIEAAERLHFEWRKAISRWPFSLAYGGIFALAFAWLHGPIAGAYVWICAAIFEMFQGGFQPRSGDGGLAPNRATMRSVQYAARVTFAGFIISSAAISATHWAVSRHLVSAVAQNALVDGARWIAFGAFILGGEKGGWFAIRHYAVRSVLWRRGVMPAGYVRFLNESVERLFLIRRGGTYEFIHVTFRDYMAARHGTQNAGSQQSRRRIQPQRVYEPGHAHLVLIRLPVC
jgi:DNA polymerase III delta prime subunit